METETKCLECGAELRSDRGTHRYGGDIGVVLCNVEKLTCDVCGYSEVVLPKVAELNRMIVESIAKGPGRLSPAEIRFLRTHLGYSSTDFAKFMGVSPETVSRWESRKNPQHMNAQAERLLRVVALSERPLESYDLSVMATRRRSDIGNRPRFTFGLDGWTAAGQPA